MRFRLLALGFRVYHVGVVLVERDAAGGGASLRDGHGDRKNGVSADVGLIRGSVHLVELFPCLRFRIF